jgi:D-alanyl-lipoteichoic acid acyltransferase DltB (MBOAT superfamily)
LFNLLVVFAVIGVWHGAGINFLIWGLLHGAGMVAHRLWSWLRRPLPRALAWFLTFNFVNVCWVFFRATSLADALKVLRAMAGLNGFAHLDRFIFLNATPAHLFALLGALLAAALLLPPPGRYAETRRFGPAQQAAAGACLLASVLFLSAPRQFIYFVF